MKDKTNAVILFDGYCNLCNASVDFIMKRDKRRQFYYASLQGEFGTDVRKKIGEEMPDSIVFWDGSRIYYEMDAVLAIASRMGFPYTILQVLRILPRKLRNAIYRFIARKRFKWFGRRRSCRVPTEEERGRFVT